MGLAYVLAVAGVVGAFGLAGCGDKGAKAAKADPQVVAAAAEAAEGLKKEETDLFARRDELVRERKKIRDDRAQLVEKRKQVVAAGGNASDVDAEEAALVDRESTLLEQEAELTKRFEGLVTRYEALAAGPKAGGGAGEDMSRREGQLAVREKDVARREDRLASREAELAAREKAQAQREKDTCGVGTTTVIQQVAPAGGSKYTKKDVEPVLQRVRRKMNEKGLLASDLPAPAQGLEDESVAAMKSGDYGKAKFAADQLMATVDSVKIDKAFISAKIGRLNAAMKGKPLAGDKKKEADELFRGATSDYGDGKFPAANGKLNKIYALMR